MNSPVSSPVNCNLTIPELKKFAKDRNIYVPSKYYSPKPILCQYINAKLGFGEVPQLPVKSPSSLNTRVTSPLNTRVTSPSNEEVKKTIPPRYSTSSDEEIKRTIPPRRSASPLEEVKRASPPRNTTSSTTARVRPPYPTSKPPPFPASVPPVPQKRVRPPYPTSKPPPIPVKNSNSRPQQETPQVDNTNLSVINQYSMINNPLVTNVTNISPRSIIKKDPFPVRKNVSYGPPQIKIVSRYLLDEEPPTPQQQSTSEEPRTDNKFKNNLLSVSEDLEWNVSNEVPLDDLDEDNLEEFVLSGPSRFLVNDKDVSSSSKKPIYIPIGNEDYSATFKELLEQLQEYFQEEISESEAVEFLKNFDNRNVRNPKKDETQNMLDYLYTYPGLTLPRGEVKPKNTLVGPIIWNNDKESYVATAWG